MQRYKKGVPYWGTPYKNIIIIIFSYFSYSYMSIIMWRGYVDKWRNYLVLLINQIHHDFYHHILFFSLTFCNHQSKGNEGVISQTF